MPVSLRPIVMASMHAEFHGATEAFLVRANADNWKRLEDAMWGLQYAQQRTDAEMESLADVAVGKLPAYFIGKARERAAAQ